MAYVLIFAVGGVAVLLLLLSGGFLTPPESITTPFSDANGQEEFSCERLGTSESIRHVVCTFPSGEEVRCFTDVFVSIQGRQTCAKLLER